MSPTAIGILCGALLVAIIAGAAVLYVMGVF